MPPAKTNVHPLLNTYLDGLDALIDGRGWNLEHQKAYERIERALNSYETMQTALRACQVFLLDDELYSRSVELRRTIEDALHRS